MKKICKKILLVFALFLAIVLVGCNANKEYIVIFEYNTGEDVTSVMVKNGSILETDDDIENIPGLKQLRQEITKIEIQQKAARGKRKFLLTKQLFI